MRGNSTISSLPAFVADADSDELESYREVLEGMEQGIIVWSEDGLCRLVNQRYFDITASSHSDLYLGQTWDAYIERLIEKGSYTEEQAASVTARMRSREIFTVERDSSNGRIMSVTVRPLDSGGHVVSLTDVTLVKQHEEKLAEALKRAEQAEVDAQLALALQQERQGEVDKLAEFGDWLHSCKSLPELYEIVSQAMQNIYPGSKGQLYIYSNSRDVLDGVCDWGESLISENMQAQDCWSLRRGRAFVFADGMIQLDCNHVQSSGDGALRSYYCLPLIAHGDTVGLLHIDLSGLECLQTNKEEKTFSLAFATRCAEQISLAVANAQLRDELHEQSTRDPLTGLFNRRYFLERCRSELSHAKQSGEEFGIAIFDADNFKTFNDHYGHDAGDAVLSHIADIAHRFFVDDDVVARIGGEEFAVLSLKKTREQIIDSLEQFRLQVEDMTVRLYNKPLPTVTVSTGFAMYPDSATTIAELVKLADIGMYESKSAGRNCVREGEKASQ